MTLKSKDITQDSVEFLRMIVALAEEKNISKAARRLNMRQEQVWEFFSRFNWDTRTPFFQQALIHNFLSSPGEQIYEQAKKLLSDLDRIDKMIADLSLEPAGTLSIVTMPFFGTEWLLEKLEPFLQKHPKVRVQLRFREPPIPPGDGDVVITLPVPGSKGIFISKNIPTTPYGLYASSAYLAQHGTPKTPEDLSRHRLISLRNHPNAVGHYNTVLTVGIKEWESPRKPYIEVDSALSLLKAVKLGYGIGGLPRWPSIENDPSLTRILPSSGAPKNVLHFICERNRERTPTIKALYEFLTDGRVPL